ncbi:MAG TPA: hypothetical protein VGN88_05870 [Phycisphaerae bacterium]|jgi:hypothetical protein
MQSPNATDGFSAKVELELYIGVNRYSLAQSGGGRFILAEPARLPGNCGEILVRVNGHEHRWLATWQESEEVRKVIRADFVAMEKAAK